MSRVTPLRIWRPSTLALRSRISKSANSLLALLHHIRAVISVLGHPRGAGDLGPEESLIHLLRVQAGEARAGRDVLNGAMTVADRESPICHLCHLGHMAVLGGELGEFADARRKV